MRGWRHHLWMMAALGMAAGSTLMWCMTRPPASAFATASPAFSGEPNAAFIDNYLTHIRTGLTAYRAHRFDEATQAFAAATALQPSEPLAYRYLAELHWRAGKPALAQQAVRSLAGVVQDAYALDQMGRSYEEVGLTELAIWVYQEAVVLDPEFPGAHYNLGRLYLEAGDLKHGIAEMQVTLHLHPDFPEAHQALGMAYTEQERFDDAIVHLQRALVLAPDLIVVRNHLGRMFLAQGRLEEAVQTFRVLVERAPDVVEGRHNLAVAYARRGQQELAIEQFKEALRLQPDLHTTRLDLAALLLEMGRFPDAIDTLKSGLAAAIASTGEGVPRELIELRYRLGLAYRMSGQRSQAIQELQAVVRWDPAHAGAHANLSYVHYQIQDFDRAWRHARRAEALGLPVPDLLAALRRVSTEPP
jgi:tetratricopeptide (TPR) repeat protein